MKSRKGRKVSPVQDTNALDDDALATGRTAEAYIGISRTTRHRLTKAGKFPTPAKIGGRDYYRMGQLRALARSRAADSGNFS